MKNIFTKNRFQRFAEKKQDNGISIIIYYDSKEKRFVKSKNRYRKAISFATVAIGSSALDKFEKKYGDPWGNIFSAKVNIYLLILFPLINIVINSISNYIDNNKESEFAYIHLTIEEAKRIYWKSWIKDILMVLSEIAIMAILIWFVSPSGGRSAAIYFLEVFLLGDLPNHFEKEHTYKKVLKERGNE